MDGAWGGASAASRSSVIQLLREVVEAMPAFAEARYKRGMYAYGPAKLPHKAYCASGAPCVLFIAFESAVDAVPSEKTAG